MSLADFVEETTTSIAGTNGNGAVTLTQLTNLPRFSSAFGLSARIVEYVIEDTVNLYFERGVGTVAGNVLTRTLPQVTWDGTVYLQSSPAPLAFGSAPASGDIRIRMAPTSDSFFRMPAGIKQNPAGSRYASAAFAYQPSAHLSCTNNGSPGFALASATEYYVTHLNMARGALVGFGLNVAGTPVAGSSLKAALYEIGTDGLPGPCITAFNAVSTAATGLVFDETPGSWGVNAGPLHPGVGWCYIGFVLSAANVTLLTMPSSVSGGIIAPTPLGQIGGYGFGQVLRKTAENSFATGMPTGTPTGTYTILDGAGAGAGSLLLLAVKNQ